MITKTTASKMLSAHKLVTNDGVEHVQFCFKDVCIMCVQDEAIQRVRELHKPVDRLGELACEACFIESDGMTIEYPCPTIKALDGEQ